MTTPTRTKRWLAAPVAGLATVALLTGCGGGGITLPTPSLSVSLPSISVSLPSISVSVPSLPALPTPEPPSQAPTTTPEPTTTPQPTKTAEPTPTPTPTPTKSVVVTATVTPTKEVTKTATATATETATATPTTASPTPTTESPTPTTESPTPSATVSAAPEPVADEGGGIPGWLWVVLALLAAGLVGFLVVRGRRRGAWDAEVADAQAEASWFARELLPQLQQTRTPDALAGAWHVSAARVGAVEDRLTGLEGSAPDEERVVRARTLRDAVRSARAEVESVLAARDPLSAPVRLADASARLQAALNPPPSHR